MFIAFLTGILSIAIFVGGFLIGIVLDRRTDIVDSIVPKNKYKPYSFYNYSDLSVKRDYSKGTWIDYDSQEQIMARYLMDNKEFTIFNDSIVDYIDEDGLIHAYVKKKGLWSKYTKLLIDPDIFPESDSTPFEDV